MKIDTLGYFSTVNEARDAAVTAERLGFDAWFTPETQTDPFVAAAMGATATEHVGIGTAIVVAFGRNPMTVALQANDLQLASEGRFVLGLGSQIRPHITRRYSMEWSHPAPRMREFILAVRAIWASWADGGKLDFAGDFYTHTLMTPFFNPGPNPHGNPKILLAAVGPLMTETAGEVADGILCHAFSTERYLREKTIPALERGRAKAGLGLEGFEISLPAMIVARDSEEERAAGAQFVRQQIAFYGSTPAYRPVLEVHGWGELQEELNAMTKRGAWDEIAGVITDEMVDAFGIVGTPEEAAAEVKRRYGDLGTRIALNVPEDADADRWAPVFEELRS
jgi:probable F420-dependent oxidoreductase